MLLINFTSLIALERSCAVALQNHCASSQTPPRGSLMQIIENFIKEIFFAALLLESLFRAERNSNNILLFRFKPLKMDSKNKRNTKINRRIRVKMMTNNYNDFNEIF